MAAIGSLVFCTACGDLLDSSTGDPQAILVCHACGTKNKDTSSKTVVTRSKPNAFPSLLRSKRSAIQTLGAQDGPQDALIDEPCPECNAPQMRHYTQQLRSADEGTTVFYRCEECGHRWVEQQLS
ncbi:MAG: hypothetical protein LQ340_002207 [Diploschistes diacapsis]|nr:MAG: hypothetical protein LQ340_002207 [Diploschistes diacapsis]